MTNAFEQTERRLSAYNMLFAAILKDLPRVLTPRSIREIGFKELAM
jgi:hypothetical protein